jgi:hypothetical protein
MQATSAEFTEAVLSPARTARVRATVDYGALEDVQLVGGSVSVDATRSVRRTCSVQILDPLRTLAPDSGSDVITPFGTELTLESGFEIGSGVEYVPLGVFVLTSVTVEAAGNGVQLTVEGSDRSLRIARNRWSAPFRIGPGTLAVDGLTALLTDRWADCPIAFDPLTEVIEGGWTATPGESSDPWADAVALAAGLGLDLAFNAAGWATLKQIPDVTSADPVATYIDGDHALVTRITRGLTMDGRYNGVIVSGESPEGVAPVTAQAWDDDPSSPTCRTGRLGEVPRFYTSSLITTVAQAQATADAMLRKELGAAESVSWTQVQNPAHDAYDVIAITRPEVGVDARYVIESLSIPVAGGTMTGSARTRTAFA